MSVQEQSGEIIKEIELLIIYGVDEKEREIALDFLKKCYRNEVALAVLKDFYSSLPGAEEEPVCRLGLLASRQGVYLLGVDALRHQYIYFANREKAGCLGPYEEGLKDLEVLSYFGLTSNEEFQNKYPSLEKLDDFGEKISAKSVACPVCLVEEGEVHHLGCAVEICPWCDGQLHKCNCRFDQLDKEEIEEEQDLIKFERLLEAKGRIPFAKGQEPTYPEDRKASVSARKIKK